MIFQTLKLFYLLVIFTDPNESSVKQVHLYIEASKNNPLMLIVADHNSDPRIVDYNALYPRSQPTIRFIICFKKLQI